MKIRFGNPVGCAVLCPEYFSKLSPNKSSGTCIPPLLPPYLAAMSEVERSPALGILLTITALYQSSAKKKKLSVVLLLVGI